MDERRAIAMECTTTACRRNAAGKALKRVTRTTIRVFARRILGATAMKCTITACERNAAGKALRQVARTAARMIMMNGETVT